MIRNHMLYALVGAVAVAPGAAFAQSADQPPAGRNAQSDASENQLGDIIVTAQKRSQQAQSTPLSIGVVTGDQLANKASNSVATALKDVPSVEVQGLAQGSQVYIRGVGSSIDPGFADPSIALMVDGSYNGRTEALTSGAYDIDRIEVLRGPQGTLYGRNASGGTVNVITTNPSIADLNGYVRGQVGNYDLRRLEAALNVPISSEAAVRLAGYREKRDGYVDDGSYDSDSWGIRGKLYWEPTSWLKVLAKVDVYREKGKGANTVPVAGSAGNLTFPPPYFITNFDPSITNGPPFTGGVPIQRYPDGWVKKSPGNAWSNNPEQVPGYIDRSAETYSLQLDADLGPATLTVLPSYTRNKNVQYSSFLFGSVLPFVGATYTLNSNYGTQSGTTEYKSIEARLTSNGTGRLKYVVGFYYLQSTPGTPVDPTTSATNQGQTLVFDTDYKPGSTIAGFGQITYSLAKSFRLTGGLRFSRDKSGQTYDVIVGSTDTGRIDYSTSQSAVQFKVGAEVDLAPRSLLYAHVATGFKSGGISATIPPIPFKPEHLTAYEIGVKNRLFDNRLQLNIAAFHYDYRNYQFQTAQSLPVGNIDATANFQVVLNAGKSRINGAEAELEWVPWSRARITGSITWLDAKYGEAILPNNPFVNQGEFNLKGKQIQNSPDWAGNVGFEQGFALGRGELIAGIHSHLTEAYYVSPEQYLPGAYQKAYTRTDLNLRYDGPGKDWSIAFWLKNLENKAQTTYVFPAYRRFITAPRTYGLTASYNF